VSLHYLEKLKVLNSTIFSYSFYNHPDGTIDTCTHFTRPLTPNSPDLNAVDFTAKFGEKCSSRSAKDVHDVVKLKQS